MTDAEKKVKLTKPQYTLLVDIFLRPRPCSDSYRPAQKLVLLGLAQWRPRKFSCPDLEITQAGLDYLKSNGIGV